MEFQVTETEQGERLDRFLTARTTDLSRSRIQQLIEKGMIWVDGETSRAGRRLSAGQRVVLELPPPQPVSLIPDDKVLFDILYEDPHIVVVDKPPGLVVHPAPGHDQGTLVNGLLATCKDLAGIGGELRPGIVHRLDKDTSGVLVVAKHDLAHRAMVEGFKNRIFSKKYLALCRSAPRPDAGEIDAPIGRHPVRRKEMSTRSHAGRPALTKWRVLDRYSIGASALELTILTGRTHQIRVHLAVLGCAVLGDSVYGRGWSGLGGPAWAQIRKMVKRQMLHARMLGINHPVTGKWMEFEAPLPEDMNRVMDALLAGGEKV